MSRIIYHEPYPTIEDVIKGKNYDYVSCRLRINEDEPDGVFAGCFKVEHGKIISLDGDIYNRNETVVASKEWSNPKKEVYHGLTLVLLAEPDETGSIA